MKKLLLALFVGVGLMMLPVKAQAATLQETLVLWQQMQTQATALQNMVAQFDGVTLTDPNQIAALNATKQQATLYQQQADLLYQQVQSLYAAQLPQQTITQTASVQPGGMVWLSRTGKKYHSIPNCSGTNPDNAYQVTLQEAISLGKEKCSVCW